MTPATTTRRDRITVLVLCLGIGVALLSALETSVPGIAAFCGRLGDGCRDTARYRLLGLPVAPWGMIYYAVLGLLFLRRRPWLFWAVMAGAGFELALVGVMARDGFFCVFCAANFLLIATLWLLHFDRKRGWEMLAVVLLAFVLGGFTLSDAQARHGRAQPSEGILARVGDREITADEVDRPLSAPLHKLRQNIYEMRNAVLQTRIDDLLIEQEARELGVTFDALVAEIRGKIEPPASHVVNHYYEAGLYRSWEGAWDGSEQEVKTRIRDYLHRRESDPLLLEYCRRLREKHPVEVFLKAPPLPTTQVRIDGAPALGPSDAPVTVVEFSDYLCPACRKGHDTVKRIREKYAGKIRWVFKDYPLDRHPGARELAIAARCAHEQGKFWAYQDRLFSGEKPPEPGEAAACAGAVGLDPARFRERLADPRLSKELEASIADAREAGIGSTPTFVINGRMRTGVPSFEEFGALIEQALAEAANGDRQQPKGDSP